MLLFESGVCDYRFWPLIIPNVDRSPAAFQHINVKSQHVSPLQFRIYHAEDNVKETLRKKD